MFSRVSQGLDNYASVLYWHAPARIWIAIRTAYLCTGTGNLFNRVALPSSNLSHIDTAIWNDGNVRVTCGKAQS